MEGKHGVAQPGTRWRRWPGVAVMLLVLAASLAMAESAPVSLAADRAWQPFIRPAAPGGGLVTHLVTAAFEAAGRNAEVHYLTWSRVLKATAEGDYDAIAGAYRTEQRLRRFLYSEPFLRFRVSLIARRDFSIPAYKNLDELKPFTIGIIRDAAYPDALKKAGLRLHSSANRGNLVRMLRDGRIDLLADTEDLFRHHALKAGLNPDDFIVVTPPLRDEPLYVVAPRGEPGSAQLIAEFNRGLQRLRDTGRYLEIRRQHGF